MRRWILFGGTVGVVIVSISTWVIAAEHAGVLPEGNYAPRAVERWLLTGPDADTRRRRLLSRAVLQLDAAELRRFAHATEAPMVGELADAVPSCRFLSGQPSGTSPKFDCVFDGGVVAKVKYGRNPEIHAETAAARLLQMLGYPADFVAIAPRLRCYGCPRLPFFAMRLRAALPLLPGDVEAPGYTEFEWVSVEHKFAAPPIETEHSEGWSWWELEDAGLPRADVDALRLTAMFLAHWDNKPSNQRLVCLDGPPPAAEAECARPLALIQDLGATFGPAKVNLAQWRRLPVWHDRATCTISMRAFPFRGGSFPDARISEAGRARLARRLAAIDDGAIAQLFAAARFPQFQVGTDHRRDLAAWVAAFRDRADQIVNARCPESGGATS